MSEHLRRRAATRLVIAAIALAIPAAWAIGRGRAAVLRARWAWRCRGRPVPGDGEKLNRADYLTFIGLVETWRQSDAPERSRTLCPAISSPAASPSSPPAP